MLILRLVFLAVMLKCQQLKHPSVEQKGSIHIVDLELLCCNILQKVIGSICSELQMIVGVACDDYKVGLQ